MARVTVEQLVKSYGATPVVKGLSLEIASGEFLALLGPSGCGKTTTLRVIAGLERAQSGRVTIDGQVVEGGGAFVPPEKRQLGMVFQSYAVWPHLTVEENVAYPLQLKKVARADIASKVTAALTQVRLHGLATRRPDQLSGGQLQRVALARALVAQPRVLLLDEPLSNLDAALRDELRAELGHLRSQLGLTFIYVTHDQGEALGLSDRVAVMNEGQLEQLAAPHDIYQSPASPFVAHFVGGATLLKGRIEQGHLHADGLTLPLPDDCHRPGNGPLTDGPVTAAVRSEDVVLGEGTTRLNVLARLFQGSSTEYRLQWGEHFLRAHGPWRDDAKPGMQLSIRVRRLTLF
jgi:iron(III) transport system ATP-binding protein